MRIFIDMHHGGLARSLFLTLQHRLGHEVYFPSASFAGWANERRNGTWLTPNFESCGGVPSEYLTDKGELKNVIDKNQFFDMNWDAVIITRPESEHLFHTLLKEHRQGLAIKRIGQAGNEGSFFEWGFVPNFLSSDYGSFIRCPESINKIHYMQELGMQFSSSFIPLKQDNLRIINTFINCLESFNGWNWDKDKSWWGRHCPHCDSSEISLSNRISLRDIWHGMKEKLTTYDFMDFGINNSCGMLNEKVMPYAYNSGALTWGYKTYEGYGHSIAQSISLGRLVLIPHRFFRYRTASQFLIPNLTCLEADWNIDSCISVIKWFTSSLERANIYSEACWKAARSIFNWEKEAFRVKEFLENLR